MNDISAFESPQEVFRDLEKDISCNNNNNNNNNNMMSQAKRTSSSCRPLLAVLVVVGMLVATCLVTLTIGSSSNSSTTTSYTQLNDPGFVGDVASMSRTSSSSLQALADRSLVVVDEPTTVLAAQCQIDVSFEVSCDGCQNVNVNDGSSSATCFLNPYELTFMYTGCPCGHVYSINHSNSTYDPTTGESITPYECWEPTWYNKSDVLDETGTLYCEDNEIMTSNNNDATTSIQFNSESLINSETVSWIATAWNDESNILGSGIVAIGDTYMITTGNSNTILPDWVNITFFILDENNDTIILQTNTIPTDLCLGTLDPMYRSGFPQMQIIGGKDSLNGNVMFDNTKKDAVFVDITIDAQHSPTPVRLEEFSFITNMYGTPLLLNDIVHKKILNNRNSIATTDSNITPRMISSLSRLIGTNNIGPTQMKVSLGPMTLDTYWRTRYTFFGTVIASNLYNPGIQCNGYDFTEMIVGMS